MKGVDFARRALEVAGDDAEILANAACVLAGFGEDTDAMIALVGSSLELNPISRMAGSSAGYSELGRASLTSRSSMSRLRCGLALGSV